MQRMAAEPANHSGSKPLGKVWRNERTRRNHTVYSAMLAIVPVSDSSVRGNSRSSGTVTMNGNSYGGHKRKHGRDDDHDDDDDDDGEEQEKDCDNDDRLHCNGADVSQARGPWVLCRFLPGRVVSCPYQQQATCVNHSCSTSQANGQLFCSIATLA